MESGPAVSVSDSVEKRAVEFVTAYYVRKGYVVTNVTRVRGDHGGYDLVAKSNEGELRLEVKGCSRPWGIPDPYCTEFDADTRRLVADFLCVVYFIGDVPPQLAIIPRDAIPPEYVVPKFGYRISGRFKNKATISPFLVKF